MANTKITNPELFNLGDSTSATQLPVMTTTQRIAMNAVPTSNIDYLVVAGGGGGARSAFTTGGAYGGGGGAGEYLYKTAQTITAVGSGYTVTVGDGGNAGISGVSATNGGNSVFIDTTLGGGYGGTSNNSTYSPGGSGGSGGGSGINGSTVYAGGSSTATSPGLGNAGGASTSTVSTSGAGGGGGAGTAGSNGTSSTGGNGGTGVQNSITSTATFYAGGGGGGSFNNNNVGSGGSGVGGNANARAAGSPGTSNTGGGGGGGSYSGSAHTDGASGGSGIVILRYPTADIASYTATGLTPTETTDGTDTILSFTTVGTGTISFTTPTGTISVGEMIFNSTTDKVEYWDGTKWYGITYAAPPVLPTQMYLDASNIASYNGGGNTWYDLSGNSNNATFSGSTAPSWNSNGYFNFDGSADIMTVSGFYGFPVQTWSIWVNPDVLERACFMQTYPSGTIPAGAMYIEMSNTSGNVEAGVRTNSSGTSSVTSTATLGYGAWTHVAVTSDGSNIKIYIGNASPVSNTAVVSSLGSNNQPLVLGYEPRNVRLWFNGQVSKVRAYNVALTQTEIDVLVAEGSGAS